MSKNKIERSYVSPMDQFIRQFDREHPTLSKAQKNEKMKYEHIYYLRDVADRPEEKILPEGF